MLSYAIVVATRNRLEMLKVSLPLFLNQTRLANRLVVVDRSDDHDAVVEICGSLRAGTSIQIEVLHGEQANSASQRNQGLERVLEDVTIYPDDDSLWYPDTAERIMAVYEADINQRYGAVSANDVYDAPGTSIDEVPKRVSRITDHPVVIRVRNWLESALVPQPFEVYGAERSRELAPTARADGLGYQLVGTIGGYRMSFRTNVAKALRFDATLGSRIGYAVHEDKDMGLRALAAGYLIAVAPGARVFHNVAPGRRANGFSYGFFQILNYLYICKRGLPEDSRALGGTHRYLKYKVLLYSLRRHDEYAREVYRGAKMALAESETIMGSQRSPATLETIYEEICDRNLQGRSR